MGGGQFMLKSRKKLTMWSSLPPYLGGKRRLCPLIFREGKIVLPRSGQLLEEFATHLANDAKRLVEDEETGAQSYRYIRTGTDHFSLAFTYDCLAATRDQHCVVIVGRYDGYIPILHEEY